MLGAFDIDIHPSKKDTLSLKALVSSSLTLSLLISQPVAEDAITKAAVAAHSVLSSLTKKNNQISMQHVCDHFALLEYDTNI